jgi:hypothetical protein
MWGQNIGHNGRHQERVPTRLVFYVSPNVEVGVEAVTKLAGLLEDDPESSAVCPLLVDTEARAVSKQRSLPTRDALAAQIKRAQRKVRLYPAIRATYHDAPDPHTGDVLVEADCILGAAAYLAKYGGGGFGLASPRSFEPW